ncbi:MAG: methylenetetrahydrofolate reductase [NAD(P)H] [Gammaproteobacteria bacterium]|nr:methylenetetrahydrofolate reductase [NAD(P)H] [Gammaproteobacteria bacterium]MDH5801238.1 methylenetetrahydrofolate reductase [NAD(P)H] [Gammaproteobacteria bacterium]
MQSQKKYNRTFSVEFFPPKTPEGRDKLRAVREALAPLNPSYFSVTFGAGGSTQSGTYETIKDIIAAGFQGAPHLSCIGSTRDGISATLQQYVDLGVKRIVALRGDLPSGMGGIAGELRYANELVQFIRKHSGDHFHIEVAAYPEFHPQARSALEDLENFKRKVQAGANSAITQYFYNADAYYRFVDSCETMGLDIPIVPGIMPITNFTQLARFSDACGAEIPQWIRRRLQAFGDDMESIRAFGFDVTLVLCRNLLENGAPGLHFYSMNRDQPTAKLWQSLGLS